MRIGVMLAVNEPATGLMSDRVPAVKIGDEVLSLEGAALPCSVRRNRLTIDGLKLHLSGYQIWVGNWCWDRAELESAAVARLVNHLRSRGWTCTDGESNLFDRYTCGAAITAQDLEGERHER